ncbi:hypothetical protein QBC44DRAFT_311529 [Cladorrhinum sp. PSN332]|nr:hypothetical protein QBC44DRAFT_311529 [Cladorrhinum sp. PSN332]
MSGVQGRGLRVLRRGPTTRFLGRQAARVFWSTLPPNERLERSLPGLPGCLGTPTPETNVAGGPRKRLRRTYAERPQRAREVHAVSTSSLDQGDMEDITSELLGALNMGQRGRIAKGGTVLLTWSHIHAGIVAAQSPLRVHDAVLFGFTNFENRLKLGRLHVSWYGCSASCPVSFWRLLGPSQPLTNQSGNTFVQQHVRRDKLRIWLERSNCQLTGLGRVTATQHRSGVQRRSLQGVRWLSLQHKKTQMIWSIGLQIALFGWLFLMFGLPGCGWTTASEGSEPDDCRGKHKIPEIVTRLGLGASLVEKQEV